MVNAIIGTNARIVAEKNGARRVVFIKNLKNVLTRKIRR